MDRAVHGGSTAALAAAAVGAGLIAVAPQAPAPVDVHPVRQIDVQLATVDLFTALAENLAAATDQLQQGLTDLFQLDLPGAAAMYDSAALNVSILIPANLLFAVVGGAQPAYATGAFVLDPLTDWSQFFPDLQLLVTGATTYLGQGLQDLFAGHLAEGLSLMVQSAAGLLEIPELFLVAAPALLGDNLLSLVGL